MVWRVSLSFVNKVMRFILWNIEYCLSQQTAKDQGI